MSPLMISASNDFTELTQALLTHQATVDLRNAHGDTALILAAKANALNSARLLMQNGANASRKNKNGLSAIDFAKFGDQALQDAMKGKGLLDIFK